MSDVVCNTCGAAFTPAKPSYRTCPGCFKQAQRDQFRRAIEVAVDRLRKSEIDLSRDGELREAVHRLERFLGNVAQNERRGSLL